VSVDEVLVCEKTKHEKECAINKIQESGK